MKFIQKLLYLYVMLLHLENIKPEKDKYFKTCIVQANAYLVSARPAVPNFFEPMDEILANTPKKFSLTPDPLANFYFIKL